MLFFHSVDLSSLMKCWCMFEGNSARSSSIFLFPSSISIDIPSSSVLMTTTTSMIFPPLLIIISSIAIPYSIDPLRVHASSLYLGHIFRAFDEPLIPAKEPVIPPLRNGITLASTTEKHVPTVFIPLPVDPLVLFWRACQPSRPPYFLTEHE